MSQENVDVARQLIQAFNRRDLEALTQRFDPEIEWKPGGPAAVERAVYRGREQASGGFAATWEAWDLFHMEESEVRDLGDSILWLGRARAGKLIRVQGFPTWHEALEAANLSE